MAEERGRVAAVEPDTKDWTWVLRRPCPDCGYDAAAVERDDVGRRVREDAERWRAVLALPGVERRPRPGTWSPVEYACHVRDVHRVFAARVQLVLTAEEADDGRDGVAFENWDQDATAVAERYDLARADDVAPALVAAAEQVAAAWEAVPDHAWDRRGRRSDGSAFTLDTLARYHLHDLVHHAWDVRSWHTRAAYEAHAEAYREGQAVRPAEAWPDLERGRGRFVAAAGPGGRVLEVGSGAGHDALALEGAGLSVRRTDVTASFAALLRAEGHPAEVLDPLTADDADLADPARPGRPHDGVWAAASLLHVERRDLPVVLRRLAGVARADAPLWLTVKEGDGEGWSTHGRVPAPRAFTYWREGPLRASLDGAGWRVEALDRADGARGEAWLLVLARRVPSPP